MAPKLPEGRPKFQPTTEEKRRQLTAARDQLRAKGYEAELNMEILTVQLGLVEGSDDDARTRRQEIERQIGDHENTRDNSYASAHRMDEMLLKLPKSKEAKKA